MFMVNETSSFCPYDERRLLVMPITPEQEEEMRRYIIVENHHIFSDVCKHFNIDSRILRFALPKTFWFSHFARCEHCWQEMVVCRDFFERKFCCKEHRLAHYRANRKVKLCICEYCGEDFLPYTYRRGRFCSRKCAAMFREEARKKAKK